MNVDTPARHKARVLVVDDSAFMRTALVRMISHDPEFEVVATACSGADALVKIASLDPDIVTMDVQMPGLDGLATLRRIMQRFPRPVIMVSSLADESGDLTFNALTAGAFDYLPKHLSSSSLEIDHIKSDLLAKLRAATAARYSRPGDRKLPGSAPSSRQEDPASLEPPAIIAIGTSTGGPRALQQILVRFPRDFSVPILIVQHMPAGFGESLAQRLNGLCAITVCQATHREAVLPGTAYLAPSGLHMRVERRSPQSQATICLDPQPDNTPHIPSADVLMSSVAQTHRKNSVGVILTGMGADGAQGMKAIHLAGGLTIGQDEATCTVYGMPRACAELGILSRVLPLSHIPTYLIMIARPNSGGHEAAVSASAVSNSD